MARRAVPLQGPLRRPRLFCRARRPRRRCATGAVQGSTRQSSPVLEALMLAVAAGLLLSCCVLTRLLPRSGAAADRLHCLPSPLMSLPLSRPNSHCRAVLKAPEVEESCPDACAQVCPQLNTFPFLLCSAAPALLCCACSACSALLRCACSALLLLCLPAPLCGACPPANYHAAACSSAGPPACLPACSTALPSTTVPCLQLS